MSEVRIRRVDSGTGLDAFIQLPFRLYRSDPNWVPPLKADFAQTLTPGRNPFWAHADRELYLAERDGQPVGRICATVDRNYNQYHSSAIGFFGFFESENDPLVASALVETAAAFARRQGMKLLYGPANPSMNDEAGLLIDGFSGMPYIKMSYNPSWYETLLESCGFTKVKDLYAYEVPVNQDPPPKIVRVMEKLRTRPGLVVRPLDLGNLQQELCYIKEVYNDAWSRNWDFAPMTDAEIDDLARQLRPIVRPELCPMVFINGEPAAMCVALPDYNQILKKLNGSMLPLGWLTFLLNRNRVTRGRLWALGVRRRFHKLGLDALLYYEAFLGARRLGYSDAELSWILEDNVSIIRPIELWRGRIHRTYRVYRLPL